MSGLSVCLAGPIETRAGADVVSRTGTVSPKGTIVEGTIVGGFCPGLVRQVRSWVDVSPFDRMLECDYNPPVHRVLRSEHPQMIRVPVLEQPSQ